MITITLLLCVVIGIISTYLYSSRVSPDSARPVFWTLTVRSRAMLARLGTRAEDVNSTCQCLAMNNIR